MQKPQSLSPSLRGNDLQKKLKDLIGVASFTDRSVFADLLRCWASKKRPHARLPASKGLEPNFSFVTAKLATDGENFRIRFYAFLMLILLVVNVALRFNHFQTRRNMAQKIRGNVELIGRKLGSPPISLNSSADFEN